MRQREIVLEKRRTTNEVAINTRTLGQLLMQQSRVLWGDQIAPMVGVAAQAPESTDGIATPERASS